MPLSDNDVDELLVDEFELEMFELYEIRELVRNESTREKISLVGDVVDRLSKILSDLKAIHMSILEVRVIVLTTSMDR